MLENFLRQLDELSIGSLHNENNNGNGKIRIVINHNWHPNVKEVFSEDSADNRNINCAYKIQNENPKRTVVKLVSRDANMRLKSSTLSQEFFEDYTTDAVDLFEKVYDTNNFIEEVRKSDIELIAKNGGAKVDQLESISDPMPNANFILRNGKQSILLPMILLKKK